MQAAAGLTSVSSQFALRATLAHAEANADRVVVVDLGDRVVVRAPLEGDDQACLTAVGIGEVHDHLVRLCGASEDDAALDLAQPGLADALVVDPVPGFPAATTESTVRWAWPTASRSRPPEPTPHTWPAPTRACSTSAGTRTSGSFRCPTAPAPDRPTEVRP